MVGQDGAQGGQVLGGQRLGGGLAQGGQAQEWRLGPAQYDLSRAQAQISHRSRRLGLRPLSPCQLGAVRLGADVMFRWTRRSRLDSDDWEEGDVPLGEESEAYRVEILQGGAVRRGVTVTAPQYLYPAAAIAADFGADPGAFSLRIRQISTVFGPGAALQRTIHA